jgi:hypothetical protein
MFVVVRQILVRSRGAKDITSPKAKSGKQLVLFTVPLRVDVKCRKFNHDFSFLPKDTYLCSDGGNVELNLLDTIKRTLDPSRLFSTTTHRIGRASIDD